MASRYIGFPIVADARDLMQRSFDYMAAKITGWLPSEGQVDTSILEATASEAADIASLTTEVPKSIFRYFGLTLFGIPPIDAVPATCTSTWFLTDALGHTITAGTQVAIADSTGALQPFTVLSDVVVPGGQTQTTAGQVVLIASNPGLAANGIGSIGGAVQLLDQLAWVDHITEQTVTNGGSDAELDDDYLNRLAIELQTMSPRPILPNDFAILARNVAGVQRAAVVDGYDPVANTFNNERMVTIYGLDSSGNPIGSTVKTALSSFMETMREINFIVNTGDAAVQNIDLTCHFKTLTGFSIADTEARVTTVINNFFDKRFWGISDTDNPNDPKTWNNIVEIRYLNLGTAIQNVPGVNYITLLEFGAHGGAQAAADYSLTGVVPLPNLFAGQPVVIGS